MSDLSTLDESDRQWNRVGALEEIENLKNIRATAWDEHSHSFRWIMASLSAINGAACLAILNSNQIGITHKLTASGLFVFGIMMALLVAVFGQHSVQMSLAPLQRIIGYWMTVASDGERDEDLENELADGLKKSAKLGTVGRLAGWLAALAFIVGAVIAGYGLAQKEQIIQVETSKAKQKLRSNDR